MATRRPHHGDREAFVARVATALLDAVAAEARRSGGSAVTLDSGHQRRDAHALHLRYGFAIVSHHFALDLS